MESTPFVAAFALAFVFTLLLTPLVKVLATRAGALDRPDARKVHKVPTPLWGGLGVFVAFVCAVGGVLLWFSAFRESLGDRLMWNLCGMVVGGALIVVLGMIDDRYGMPAKVKLLGQLAIAAIMIGFGIRIDNFSTPVTGMIFLETWQAAALTMFWLVGITNAINLLDGLDGLVAGVALGSALIFLLVAGLNGQWLAVLAMAALAGCALGFLKYNFNPAQIFMGDTGSLFLGLMFAGWSIIGLLKTTATLALTIPILIMGVPILDTSFAIVRRGLKRRPIFQADKGHFHHRLLGMGLSQRQAVVLIYVINVMFGLAGLAVACVAR